MNPLRIVAILAIPTMPLFAQSQPDSAKLKADAQKVAELPKGIKPDGLPSEFTQQISELADYVYSKMKDQILLVNEMR